MQRKEDHSSPSPDLKHVVSGSNDLIWIFPSRMPDLDFFIADANPDRNTKLTEHLRIFNPKIVTELSKIWSALTVKKVGYVQSLKWKVGSAFTWKVKKRFGRTLPLFLFIFTLRADIQYFNILLVEHHSCCPHCFPLGRGPPLGCRAEIRTRACRTASRRATIWATPHPVSHAAPGSGGSGSASYYAYPQQVVEMTSLFLAIFRCWGRTGTFFPRRFILFVEILIYWSCLWPVFRIRIGSGSSRAKIRIRIIPYYAYLQQW